MLTLERWPRMPANTDRDLAANGVGQGRRGDRCPSGRRFQTLRLTSAPFWKMSSALLICRAVSDGNCQITDLVFSSVSMTSERPLVSSTENCSSGETADILVCKELMAAAKSCAEGFSGAVDLAVSGALVRKVFVVGTARGEALAAAVGVGGENPI